MASDPVEALRELIEDWMRARNATQADVARASGVPQNVLSKWLNRQVDDASSKNLKRIAPMLGLTYEQLLRRMGELPSGPVGDESDDPIEKAIRQRTAEMREAVDGIPRPMWATVINKLFDRAIDGARDMAALLAEVETQDDPVRNSGARPDSKPAGASNKRTGDTRDHLATPKVGALAFVGSP